METSEGLWVGLPGCLSEKSLYCTDPSHFEGKVPSAGEGDAVQAGHRGDVSWGPESSCMLSLHSDVTLEPDSLSLHPPHHTYGSLEKASHLGGDCRQGDKAGAPDDASVFCWGQVGHH